MADQATDQSILYKAIPTSIGLTKIQLAMTTGVDLILSTIGYGDGGGAPIVPDPDQTSLVNQIGSTDIIGTEIDTETNVTWYSGVIEAGVATGTLREIGLFDSDGNLCFVGNVPDIILPEPAEGVAINVPIQLGVKNYYSRYISIQTNIKVIEQIEGSGGYSLFDLVQKDHILSYEESEGFALQGTYVYKDGITGERYGYPDFIQTCIDEKNSEDTVIRRIPLGENTITGYVNPNGHVYYDIVDKAKVDAYYEQYGVAWFWGIDEENETVFLPRNSYFFKSSSIDPGIFNPATLPSLAHNHNLSLDQAGEHSHTITIEARGSHTHTLDLKEDGLHSHGRGEMNITGTISGLSYDQADSKNGMSGAFSWIEGTVRKGAASGEKDRWANFNAKDGWIGNTSKDGLHTHDYTMSTDGSHSHPITVQSNGLHTHSGSAVSKEIVPASMVGDTVTPPSVNLLLYIVVGNVRRKFAMVVDQIVEEAIEAIEQAASDGVEEVEQEVETGKTELNNTLNSAKGEINDLAQEIEDHIASEVDAAKDYAEASEYWAEQSEYWAGISTQGQQQADWDQTDPTKVDYIKNKPQVDWTNLVYLNSAQTLTNKTIDASNNTISNLGFSSISQGVILTSLGEEIVSNTTLATSQAIWQAIKNIKILFNNLDPTLLVSVINDNTASMTTLATSQAIWQAIKSLPTSNMTVVTSITDSGGVSNNSLPTSLAVYTAILDAVNTGIVYESSKGLEISSSRNTTVNVRTSRDALVVASSYTGTQSQVGVITYNFTYVDSYDKLKTQTSITSSNPNLIVNCYYTGTQSQVGIITYNFTYVEDEYGSNYWAKDGVEIDLADYSVSVMGTPTDGDVITLTYTTTTDTIPAHWEDTSGTTINLASYYLSIVSGTPQPGDTIRLTYTTTNSIKVSINTEELKELLGINYVFQDGIISEDKLNTKILLSVSNPDLTVSSSYTGTESSIGTISNVLMYSNNQWIDYNTDLPVDLDDYDLSIVSGTPQEDDTITLDYITTNITAISSNIEFSSDFSVSKGLHTQVLLSVSNPDLTISSSYTGTESSIGTKYHQLTYDLKEAELTTTVSVSAPSNLQVDSTFSGHKSSAGTIIQHFLYTKETSLVTNTSVTCSNTDLQVDSTFTGHKSSAGTLLYSFTYRAYNVGSDIEYGWFLNDSDLVDLTNYDLEVTGTPQEGDVITLTYTTTEQTDYLGWVYLDNSSAHVDLDDYDLSIVSGTPQIGDSVIVTYVTTSDDTYQWVDENQQEVDLDDYDLSIISGTPQENDTISITYITTQGKVSVSVNKNNSPSVSGNSIATTKFARNLQTYQPYTTFTGGSISLQDDISIYVADSNIDSATTFTFSTSNLHYLTNSIFYTFELKFTLSTVSTLTFPSNIVWQDGQIPDFDTVGTYLIVFRTWDSGTTWVGNLQGYWA